jgi:uncharacterized protein YcbX
VYPIKALDGVDVESLSIEGEGHIQYDRQYAMFDEDGNYVNGRQNQRVHKLQADIDLDAGTVEISSNDRDSSINCALETITDDPELEAWLSEFFDEPVTIERAKKANFTDSAGGISAQRMAATGPTIVSTATLREVASWYDKLDADSIRRRLRTNFEIGGTDPFWEDRLFTDQDHAVEFTVGDVTHHGIMSKPRCVTPSRDPDTGELNENFSKRFIEKRRESFPEWADEDHLGQGIENDILQHYYYLTVVTRIPETEVEKRITVGDEVEIDEEIPLLQTL